MTGIDPVVSPAGACRLSVEDRSGGTKTLNLQISGFSCSPSYGIDILGDVPMEERSTVRKSDGIKAKAVRTALATLSVVFTPKSFYGGKNPSTKRVTYHVHNVHTE